MNTHITYGSTYTPALSIPDVRPLGGDQSRLKYLSAPVGELADKWEKAFTPAYSRVGPLSAMPQWPQSYLQSLMSVAKLYALYGVARYKQARRRLGSWLKRRRSLPVGAPAFIWTRRLATALLVALLIGVLAWWPTNTGTKQPIVPNSSQNHKAGVSSNTSSGTSGNNGSARSGVGGSTPDTQAITTGSPLIAIGQLSPPAQNGPSTQTSPGVLELPYTVVIPAQSLQAGDKQIIGTSPISITLN